MEQIKIDIVPVGVAPVAHASQFDNGRQIRFNLFNQGTPYTLTGAETVTMVVNGEEENITNTSDDYVIWDVAEEDCAEVGVIGCEIRIVLGSMLIGSKNFFLEVEMDPYDGKNIRIVTVGPTDICTFETTLAEPLQSVLVNVEATGGNGTLDNPNPINGYTEANITRCGVNLWDGEIRNGYYISSTGVFASNGNMIANVTPIKVIPNSTIYIASGTYNISVTEYDANMSFIRQSAGKKNETLTLSATTAYINFSNTWNAGSTYNNDISINYPATDTNYHAYNGTTATIAFGQTVYGGVLDVTRGKLTVTHFIKDSFVYGETALIAINQYNIANFGIVVSTPFKFSEGAISNCLPRQYTSGSDTQTPGFFINNSNELYVRVESTTASTVSDFVTWANANLQILFTLATPFDIDLTPEVISAVVGENNVFADCGETTVKYLEVGA